jgi:hypothetical protein
MKEEVSRTGDYMSISLVHSISKIFSKILATRLAPKSAGDGLVKPKRIHKEKMHS